MRFAVLLIAASAAVFLVIVLAIDRYLNQPLPLPAQGLDYRLEAGTSLSQLTAALSAQGLLERPGLLLIYARLRRLDRRLHAGEYHFPPGTSSRSLLQALSRGSVVKRQVTLVDGWTFHRALETLHQAGLRPELAGLNGADILQRLGIVGYASPEGLFYPDTYYFRYGDSDIDILRTARRKMLRILAAEWEQRSAQLPYADPYDALILASIVERETALAQERELVAGVFARRLEKGMRLEADPTVIYGLGAGFDGNLRRKHLEDRENPYNTYRISALPPTPIALPGRAALRAVLRPVLGDNLYFVARGDGSHIFSATLEEHHRAVRDYQVQRKQQ